ncbi:MAG TPA: hypothetical protein VER55_08730, partial [Ardenticatenaceae bacterium]|nr:hypothetical protein [Ardenticatenaceae bacterium]
DRVLTISLHEGPQFHFPGTGWWQEIGEGAGKGYTVNVGLPPATGDEPYLWAFEEVVVPLLERFGADVLVTTTGLDAHYDDPLAHLRLSTHGFARLWRRLRSLVPRWVAVGGAGQNLDIAARAWAILYAVLVAREGALPQRLPRRYVDAWGPGMLHDDELAPLSKELDEYVWTTVRAQVRALQRLVFPLHGLHAPPLAPGAELELLERPAPAPAPLTASIPFARRPSTRGATPLRRARPAQREHEYPAVEDEVPTRPVDRDEVVSAGQPGPAPAALLAPRDETQGDAEARRGRRRGRRGRRPADSEPANRREPGSRLAEDQTTQRRGSGNRSRPRGASERRPAPPAPSGEKGPAADGESRPGRRRRRGGRRGRNPVEG